MNATAQSARPRGAILLIVLGFIVLASVVTVALLETMTRHMRSAATAAARDDLRLTAFSAMEVALATLAEIKELDGNLYSPSQGWGDPMSYAPVNFPAEMSVTISIEDETGKIPLDPENREMLNRIFDQLGVSIGESDELIDVYIDWTDEDDLERISGAEESYYERQDPPRKPPNEPITSFDDFRYMKAFDELFFDENGAPNDLFRQFKSSVTLKHTNPPNLNTASPLIRNMLSEEGGLNEHALEDLQLGLDGIAGTEDDGYIKSQDDLQSMGVSDSEGFGFEAKVFRVTVTVEQGVKKFQLYALISDTSEAGEGSGGNGDGADGDQDGDSGDGSGGGSGRPGSGGSNGGQNGGDGYVTGDDSYGGGSSGGSGSGTPVYIIGSWEVWELSENGAEDG